MAASAEPTSRFAHLLQPIRDLSKVWKIEIAEELEKYIEECAQLLVTDPEDGITQLNFAEAALLIQGSTAIYSRKVELLYALVYQALDLLALDTSGKEASGKKGKAVQSGLWAPIPETEELLTIDHLIKEGRNIILDHSAPQPRQAEQRRVPLFLMPRDASDRRKTEFRISSCTVHPSGVYLLQASDAKLLDDPTSTGASIHSDSLDAPLVPAPPSEVQDLDSRLQELRRGLPADGEFGDLDGLEKAEENLLVNQTPARHKTPLASMALAGVDLKHGILSAPDPWALLDEHQTVGQDLPLEVGCTSRRVNAKKLLMNAEGLPDATSFGGDQGLPDAELWHCPGEARSAASMAPMLAAGNPVESLFLAVAGHLRTGGRYETQRAGFSAAWLEFEDLFTAAATKRRHLRSSLKRPGAAHASDDEASDTEVVPQDCGVAATPKRFATPAHDTHLAMTPLRDLSDEQLRQQEQRKEVAMLETMIEDAQLKYESTIRQHLAAMQKDGIEADDRRFPQLYANVKRWQDQLEPVLKEFETRPDFNIHEYSNKFLSKMVSIQKGGGEDDIIIPFSRLVYGQPRYEVCRRFLTCLLLTNQGNTDLIYETEEERLNKFKVKMLKAEKRMISMDGEEAAGGAQPAALPNAEKQEAHKAGAAAAGSGQATRKRQKRQTGA